MAIRYSHRLSNGGGAGTEPHVKYDNRGTGWKHLRRHVLWVEHNISGKEDEYRSIWFYQHDSVWCGNRFAGLLFHAEGRGDPKQKHKVAIGHVCSVLDCRGISCKPPVGDHDWFTCLECKLFAYFRWWLAELRTIGKFVVHRLVQCNGAWIWLRIKDALCSCDSRLDRV